MPVRLKNFCFLALAVLVTACTETPIEPTTGAITGTVLPPNAASLVYLIQSTDTLKINTKSDGTYELSELEPGNYTLSAKPTFGYAPPVAGPIIINAGFTTQAYPIRMPKMPDSGLFAVALQDSVVQDSVFTGTPVDDLLGDPEFTVVSGPYRFIFKLPKISGTASFNTTTNPDLRVEVQFNKQVWVADSNQGTAELKITQYDQATKRGNATFSFTAVNTGAKDIVGTKGKLLFVKLRR